MNNILAYKEKVRSVVEAHDGEVAIDFIPGVVVQPDELKPAYNFTHDYYNPVELVFTGYDLKINITSGLYDEAETRELLKRIQAVVAIMDESKLQEEAKQQ